MTSARPDTRYLATTSGSTIDIDLGQRLTDLTASAPGGYETSSTRTSIAGTGSGRSIELIADIDDGQVGTLVDHTHTGIVYQIKVTAGGVVEFHDATTGLLKSITAPNVSGAATSYVIAWSTEPNPLTTGASDALRSEFLVYDVAGAELAWDTALHTVPSVGAGTFTIAGVWNGAMMTNTYSPAIDAVRISCRFHTRTETREHFVAQTAAPTVVGIQACEAPRVPVQMIAPGMPVGPAYQFAAASMKPGRNRHRLVSKVWHRSIGSPTSFQDDITDAMSYKLVHNWGDGWQTPLWVVRRQLPRTLQHLRVQIQLVTYRINPLGTTDKVAVRFHTSDQRPTHQQAESSILHERTVDDGSAMALGALVTFDDFCKIERGADGYTWMWWSFRTDDGSGSGNAAYAIRGWDVMPVAVDDSYGGAQVPNPWGP